MVIYQSLLPTPEEIKAEFPLKPELAEMKAKKDKEIAAVFTRNELSRTF